MGKSKLGDFLKIYWLKAIVKNQDIGQKWIFPISNLSRDVYCFIIKGNSANHVSSI